MVRVTPKDAKNDGCICKVYAPKEEPPETEATAETPAEEESEVNKRN